MSQNELHDLANSDTPSKVEVPQGWSGLLVWAVGRFGVGILCAVVFGWWLMRVYGDLRNDAEKVLSAFQLQAVANAQTVIALQQLTLAVERVAAIQKEVDRNSNEINSLKRKVEGRPTPP